MLLKLLKYTCEVNYISNKDINLADTLSWTFIKDAVQDDREGFRLF